MGWGGGGRWAQVEWWEEEETCRLGELRLRVVSLFFFGFRGVLRLGLVK